MAHPLLHISAVRVLERDPNVHPLVGEAVRRRRGLALLGALLPDLPRFEAFTKKATLATLARGLPEATLSQRLHARGAITLGLDLIRNEGELGPLARLALGVGFFSHAALDSALHPLTESLVRKDLELAGGDAPVWHARSELFQMLHLHARMTGRDADEDHDLWRALGLREGEQLDRALFHVAGAVKGILPSGPDEAGWRGFLDGLDRYASLVRGKLRKAEGGKEDESEARARYVTGCGLEEKFIHAQGRAVAWVNRLGLAFEPGELSEAGEKALREWFPDGGLMGPEDPFAAHAVGPELAAHREHARIYLEQADARNAADHTAVGSVAEVVEAAEDEFIEEPVVEDVPLPEVEPVPASPDESTGWNLAASAVADPVAAALAEETGTPVAPGPAREAMRPTGRVPK